MTVARTRHHHTPMSQRTGHSARQIPPGTHPAMIASVLERVNVRPSAPWAALVALVALWCVGQVVAGEPALDAPDVLPPAVYVVAPDVVEVTVVPPAAPSPEARAAAGLPPAAAAGSVTSTTPFADEPAAAPSRGTHGSTAAGSSASPTSEGER